MENKTTYKDREEAIELAEEGREMIRDGVQFLRDAIGAGYQTGKLGHYEAYLIEQIEEHIEKTNPYNTDIEDLIRDLKVEE